MGKNVLTVAKKKKAQALLNDNQLLEARDLLTKVCELDKLDVEARLLLGIVYGKLEMHQLAAECFSQVILYQPSLAKAHFNLGIALRALAQFEGAVMAFQKAIELDPTIPDAQVCLAHALMVARKYEEAIAYFQTILKNEPGNAEMCSNLGMAYQATGRLDEAVDCYRRAQAINPSIAYENLGSALTGQGKFHEAVTCYRAGLARKPGDYRTRSNLLLTLNYMPNLEVESVFKDHLEWGKRCAGGNKNREFSNVPDKVRKLRVGYVSPDFREHSVAYFIEPLLVGHSQDEFEVYCYSNLSAEHHDAVTARIRSLVKGWRDLHALSSEQVAERVRADGIDILLDLSGHTANHSLAVFALKPAPIQVTYLGYPNTTGMEVMDYRLTDSIADMEDAEKYYAEKLIRLPGCFLCYQPPHASPDVSPLPASNQNLVTFGSFNNLAKMNDDVLAVWAELLCKMPDSKLFLKNASLADRLTRDRLLKYFEKHGILADRVEMQGITSTTYNHLELYGKVDIALDTFPYNGTTTTCEALWMGVPVVALAGERHSGRVGVSLLNAVGLANWIAATPAQYVSLAIQMAADIPRLAELRAGLRECMAASLLCEGKPFAARVEAAYREMWRKYCAATQSC